jgi:hypothetical protein
MLPTHPARPSAPFDQRSDGHQRGDIRQRLSLYYPNAHARLSGATTATAPLTLHFRQAMARGNIFACSGVPPQVILPNVQRPDIKCVYASA